MARMLPNQIDQEDLRRDGERLVFEWFSEPNIPGTVFYSLLQKNHRRKLIGEIDFLYVCERGLLCVEVKGGQHIFRQDGIWYSTNKAGQDNEIKNPFKQAMDCQYALKRYLEDTYGKNSRQANYLVGYAVVFPECIFTGNGNDLVTEVMFDGRYSINQFGEYLNSVFDYWEKLEIERHYFHPQNLTNRDQNQIVDLLCGDFSVVPSLSLELQQVERKMLQLTEEQYDILEDTEYNDRLIVQGVAGTGKSLLALEKVRECAAKEKRVLYLCYNSNMATYAKSSLKGADDCFITVSTFHALIQNTISDNSLYKKTLDEVCRIFNDKKTDVPIYDYLVIDEGQDLLLCDVIDVLGCFISGGIEKGKWIMFLDPNQNIFNRSDEYDFAWSYLREIANPAIKTLNYNCRNTEQIALRTAALTLIPPAKKLKIPGPNVKKIIYTSRNDFVSQFKKQVTSLLSGGISSKEIVILSRYRLGNSMLSGIGSVCNLTIDECDNLLTKKNNTLNYFTIQSYKGLEASVVLLIDIDGFGSDTNRLLNYVAMSRAKAFLYMFFSEDFEDEYDDTIEKGREMIGK